MIKGIQDSVLREAFEQILADMLAMEKRIAELEKLAQPPAHYLFKPFGEEAPSTGIIYTWPVPKDVDGLRLEIAEAGYTQGGSGSTQIQLENLTQGTFPFYSNLFINSGDEHSDDSSPEVEIDHTQNQVFWKDQIAIRALSIASGAEGLSVTLGFV